MRSNYDTKTVQEIMAEFKYWNGWGPPSNQFQIVEYMRHCSESSEEADLAEKTLAAWMRGEIKFEKPSIF